MFQFLYFEQEAYPVKVKEVHVINVSPLVDTIINFVKPILKEKLRERVSGFTILKIMIIQIYDIFTSNIVWYLKWILFKT